jgi:cell surface protein SprA
LSLEKWKRQFLFGLGTCVALCLAPCFVHAQKADTTKKKADTLANKIVNPARPTYRPSDRYGDPFSNQPTFSPLFLKDPKSLNLDMQIDTGMNYSIYEKIGKVNFRPTTSMSFNEFNQLQTQGILKDYFKNKSSALDGESAVTSKNILPKIYISPVLDRIFGGSYVELVPRGFVTLDFGANFQKIANPNIPIRQQKNGGFQFDQQINLSVVGKIGTKMKVTTNFDNNNSFDFQNNMKIEYTGNKEDILKKLEIGNVSLPLNNSLISGAQNLFGVKAQLQFGKLFVTALAATQRGKQSTITVQGSTSGASQGKPFEIIGSGYDENRHFFLGQFFRDNFEAWLSTIPQISSGVNITRVEVYMLNRQNDTQSQRNVVGFMDMAEGNNARIFRNNVITGKGAGPNGNDANNLFDLLKTIPPLSNGDSSNINASLGTLGLESGLDYETITSARKLSLTEYTINAQLGYITLQRKLQNDEAVAVAYEYTYNGKAYKVGQLSEDYSSKPPDQAVYLKLLRPKSIKIKFQPGGRIIPTWNLMMKNIYNLNVTQLTREGFQLRVIYRDDRTGKDNPQLQEGVYARTQQLINVMGLDKLNPYNDPQPDGNFDFVDGITVNTQTGLIIFPFLEPFNEALRNLFKKETDLASRDFLINKYVYDTLYHTTQAEAVLALNKNKFYIVGTFKAGAGKDIIIQGFNISQGSVKVYAGGTPLREGTDYTVDYTFGKVTILNDGILNSGKDITINYEQQDPFAFQTRSLLGTRLDYKLSDDINLGSTFLYYNERPLISRNLIGTEPARNMMYGLDLNVKKNSRFLTKMVDKLPFLQTKETSTVSFSAEYAQLLPGTSNIVNGQGTSFIDDFENTATPYSLISPVAWHLASVPKSAASELDPSQGATNDLSAGYKRAKLAWYQIDNLFYSDGLPLQPKNLKLDNHYVRSVNQREIFPYRDAQVGNFNEPILNLAYYPSERGPYNYSPNLNSDGTLKNPASNWAGITTAIRTEVDFDKANIEYVEFWLMDPFIQTSSGRIDDGRGRNEPNTDTGGKMVFQLGDIAEDVVRDGFQGFENGLPSNGDTTSGVKSSKWGFAPSAQFLNNAFDTDPNSRTNQDVGLDGAKDNIEQGKFASFIKTNAAAQGAIVDDPSADNFKYFLGDDYDNKQAQVLERYKNINGMENNSPILSSTEVFAKSGTIVPDNEDLNQDNTLNDPKEQYYSYNIDLSRTSLKVGSKFIVDQITVDPSIFGGTTTPKGEAITWYLFRIPIRDYDGQFGEMSGFKSIKYIRTYLTGFTQPVVLRMANFRSVGNRWRAYAGNLEESAFKTGNDNFDNVTVSAVNVEENGQGSPPIKPPYIEPLRRDRDNTSVVQRRLNEQSVQLCVTDLTDGDARSMYKSVSMDFFNYHHLNMFFSAHGQGLKDNDVRGFIRLGTDFDQNYYEIEVPLKLTDPNDPVFGNNNRNLNAVDAIWPDYNTIDLDLDELYALKVERDREGFPLGESFPLKGPKVVGRHGLRIFGRPDLSQVKLMMIGVRNPRGDNTRSLNVCIWADELRLTHFDRTAGWAVNTVLNAKLADLGTVTGSLRHSTLGFGGVQSKISERTRAETTIFDVSANINVDKLLPKSLGLKIPMFASYESNIINPGYDPANPDVRIAGALKSFGTEDERTAYLKLIQDRSYKRSLNLTNVHKVKLDPKAATHIYDIENFSASYAYAEATQQNFNLLENTKRNTKGSLAYQYTSKFKGFEPFKNIKALSSPFFQLIKDFNFNPLPTNISIRGELERAFGKIAYRNSSTDVDAQAPNYLKYFIFNRYYSARWNLTKALSVDYNAKANAIIDEKEGDVDTEEKKNFLINNLKKGGRMKYFEQNITANYTLPLDKFPITNWLGAEYRYNVGYSWTAGPQPNIATDTITRDGKPVSSQMGNIIRNNRDQGVTGRLDMVRLYNKISFLKDINTPKRKLTPAELVKLAKARPDSVKPPPNLYLVKGVLRLIMSLRNVSGTYTLTQGTVLPGFTQSPKFFGMDKDWNSPGWGFLLGSQDPSIRFRAADKGWITQNTNLTTPFTQSQLKDLSLRANLEPSPDIKIQLDVKKTSTSAYQEIFRMDTTGGGGFVSLSPSRSGSYRISTISIKTAFKNNGSLNSSVFENFRDDITVMQKRFNSKTGEDYANQSQDVLIPAFIAAYTGKNPDKTGLSPFPSIPLPNWRIDFAGLNKIQALSDIFQSVTLTHAYTSSYMVSNFTNSLQYGQDIINKPIEDYNNGTYAGIKDNDSGQLIPVYVISQVMISEQFAPLVGVNIRTKSKLNFKVEYKTSRNLALTVSNAQITELNTKDWSAEIGFTKNNMKLPFKDQGRVITLKNDITFRLTLAVTNTQTIQRRLDDVATVTNGNINFQLRPNINYVVNQKLNIQFYVDRNVNDPLVTSSYRRSTTQIGMKILFNLAQ